MPKSRAKLLDDLRTEMVNYRCGYLQVLIEKYVKNQDKGVDIHLETFAVTRSSKEIKSEDYLKELPEKPFGYVSSYECKTAKKTLKYMKKQVILEKRAYFRKHVGAESSAELLKNLKYLTRNKAYKTLLSVQKDRLCSSGEECESTLLNETELDGLSFNEDESTLSYRDTSLSDTVKNTSNESHDEVCEEDETFNTVVTKDVYPFSANVQKFSNFTIKNCKTNLLKPNNHKKLDLLIENFLAVVNNNSIGKASKIVCQKVSVHFKGISSPENNSVSSVYNNSSGTSFLNYISSKSTPKFKFSDIGLGISNKNSEISSFSNVKALPYTSSNSAEFSHTRIGMETLNKNYQHTGDCNAESLSYISKKNAVFPKSKSEKINMVQFSNDSNSKSSCVSKKSTNGPKLRSKEDRIASSNENYKTVNNSYTKSISYASNKDTQAHKLTPSEGKKVISNKNCESSNECSAKSSMYVSNKSTLAFKLRPRENGKVVSSKNSQSSNDCHVQSLSCASAKSVEDSNLMRGDQTCNEECGISNDSNFEPIKSIEDPSLKCGENTKITSNKNCDKSNDCNTKSLSNVSNKSIRDPNLKPREDGKQDSNINCGKSSDCNTKSLSNATYKSSEAPKLRSRENGTSNKNYQTSNNCDTKSLLPDASVSCTEAPNLKSKKSEILTPESIESSKLKPHNNGAEISNKNVQTCSRFNTKSLPSASNKFAELSQLKFNKIDREPSNKNLQGTDCSAKSLFYISSKHTEVAKFKTKGDDIVTSKKNCETSNASESFSFASSKHTGIPKLRPRKDGTGASKTYFEAHNVRHAKSLICASDKSIEPDKHKYSESGTRVSNRNRQTLSSYPLRCTSLLSSFGSNLGISVEIDPLSLRRASYSKRPCKKKPLSQSTLPFSETKSYKKYLDEGVKIDDLSLKASSPRKTPKNKHKEDCSK